MIFRTHYRDDLLHRCEQRLERRDRERPAVRQGNRELVRTEAGGAAGRKQNADDRAAPHAKIIQVRA